MRLLLQEVSEGGCQFLNYAFDMESEKRYVKELLGVGAHTVITSGHLTKILSREAQKAKDQLHRNIYRIHKQF